MHTEGARQPSLDPVPTHPVAARRILRLALGTSLCLLVSQLMQWPMGFIAPVLTMFILALPVPAPRLKQGIVFVAALLAPMIAGLALIPFLYYARWAGVVLVAVALFYSFRYTARGGNPVLGSFMTMGLTMVVTVGSTSVDALVFLIQGLAVYAIVGIVFVWIAHAALPELPSTTPSRGRAKLPRSSPPDPMSAARSALRSMLIVFPLVLLFLFMSASPSYTTVMIKVATMGQQASADRSRQMGVGLLASTLWGGVGAIVCWYVMGIWPSLVVYVLLVALAALIYGRWIFQGTGLHSRASEMSYALLTMLVILAPALASESGDATARFYSRLFLFVVIAVYGTAAVAVFDAFWPAKERAAERVPPSSGKLDTLNEA